MARTAGVLALGVALSASSSLAPESAYPMAGGGQRLLLASIGGGLAWRARPRSRRLVSSGHDDHDYDHDHHGPHLHDHGDEAHHHVMPGKSGLGWRALAPVGLAGGMVPSPSALVVLVGAIALGRAWFGVALVVAYGAGMAATLTLAGLLLVRARAVIERRFAGGSHARFLRVAHVLPLATVAVVLAGGLYLTGRSAASL